MVNCIFFFTGKLELNGKTCPVHIMYRSKATLFISFLQAENFEQDTQFDNLHIGIKDEILSLGSCKYHQEPDNLTLSGYLIFTDNLVNFDQLLFKDVLEEFDLYFEGIRYFQTKKSQIKDSFKKYLDELTYDMEIYKIFFDEFDKKYQQIAPHVYEALQKTVFEKEENHFICFFNTKLQLLQNETSELNAEENKLYSFYFRKQIWKFILLSDFFTRANTKPTGYAGDAWSMKMIYENSYHGNSTFSKLLHKTAMEQPIAEAVRKRKLYLIETFQKFKNRLKTYQELKILSVGCGPANELKNLFTAQEDFSKYKVTLLDEDSQAIQLANATINALEKQYNAKIQVSYINQSIRTTFCSLSKSQNTEKYHFIYALELFDYLNDPVASSLLHILYDLLMPGGELLISNYRTPCPSRHYLEYWLDWVLEYRTKKDLVYLARYLPQARLKVTTDDQAHHLFLHVKKKG
jgi:extracellular factor (EF) 3-hydroxypalmitic acid methyl ester biosynthesis protein